VVIVMDPNDDDLQCALVPGYRSGILAEIVALHMEYYTRFWDFGVTFETKVGGEIAGFLRHYRSDRDLLLSARLPDGTMVGSITVEGPHHDPDKDDAAHLRWFIVSDSTRGRGVGRALLQEAVWFCDDQGYPLSYLTTFSGLHAARHLYESVGFRLVATSAIDQWGAGVQEQRFERPRGG
jgi:GNAT superfamily N-acetyltransferase